MKIIWPICFSMLLFTGAAAQNAAVPRIPEHYTWKSARDYKRDEDLVMRTLLWLCQTPLNTEPEYRSKANLFVMEWIAGSPRLKIEITSTQLPFYERYPDLLFPYIQGIALKKLSKSPPINELEAMVSGFNVVGFMILTDAAYKREKDLQPLLKAYKKNKLTAFAEECMAITNRP